MFIIRQIPREWRSYHLRNFFDQLIQEEAFATFHFKHRREKTPSAETSCCVVQLNKVETYKNFFFVVFAYSKLPVVVQEVRGTFSKFSKIIFSYILGI